MTYPFRKLGSFGNSRSGATPSRAKHEEYFVGGTTPWVKTLDLNNSYVKTTDECITDDAIRESSVVVHPPGTILVAMYGGFNQIGRTGLLKIEASTNQAISAVRLDLTVADSYFVLEALNHYRYLWKRYAASSRKDPNITRDDVDAFKIPLPPLPTQRRIAAILQTWDRAIALAEQQLQLLQNRKRGLMQLLLTGEKRLLGFDGEWEAVRLGDLYTTYSGLSGVTKEDFGAGEPYVSYMNVFNGVADLSKYDDLVDLPPNCKQASVAKGDLLMTISSETPEEAGMTAAILLEPSRKTYLNSFCFGLRPVEEDISVNFMSYFTRSSSFRRSVVRTAQGSTRFNLSKRTILDIRIKVPEANEQVAIYKVLDEASVTITLQKDKIERLRAQKKGLMQRLLDDQLPLGEEFDKYVESEVPR